MNRVRLMVVLALIAGVLTVVLATDLPSAGVALGLTRPDAESPEALLHRALEQAGEAGSFEVSIPVTPHKTGTLSNPDGNCRVDPEGKVTESDESNNNCPSNTVNIREQLVYLPYVVR